MCDVLSGEKCNKVNEKQCIYFGNATTWYQALNVCQGKGGHLATVQNEEQRKVLTDMLDTRSYWVGGANRWWKWNDGMLLGIFQLTS